MQDVMCGKRAPKSFKDSVRAKKVGEAFECPTGYQPCQSQNINDATYCYEGSTADSKSMQCPIYSLYVMEAASYPAW